MKYTIYFKFFDKRMKYNTEANSKEEAIKKIHDAIEVTKVDSNDTVVDYLNGLFGFFKEK